MSDETVVGEADLVAVLVDPSWLRGVTLEGGSIAGEEYQDHHTVRALKTQGSRRCWRTSLHNFGGQRSHVKLSGIQTIVEAQLNGTMGITLQHRSGHRPPLVATELGHAEAEIFLVPAHLA